MYIEGTCDLSLVQGGWGEWTDFSPCTVTCGEALSGEQVHYRVCNNPTPVGDGMECVGNETKVEECPYFSMSVPCDSKSLYIYCTQ